MRLRVLATVFVALMPLLAVTAQTGSPARVSGGVMATMLVHSVPPVYPVKAKAAHVSGAVVLHAVIGTDGHVRDATPIAGPDILRLPAVDAVCEWVYHPYLLNGKAVDVDTTITVNFKMVSAPPAR